MKTIGELIKETRVKKRYSRERLENITKIRKDYIKAIEEEDWDNLPEKPVVAGFIKNISQALAFSQRRASALFRRDYPPKTLTVNPKPDVSDKFVWSPKLTFMVGVFVVISIILGYLVIQYLDFISPPKLEITAPYESEIVREGNIEVVGSTDPDISILVNNQPVIVKEDGSFIAEIEIYEGTEEILVTARSRSGKETVIHRKIVPELGEP